MIYRGGLADSSRWQSVRLRPGDIVISVPSKCGTSWMQMICALLIFRTPALPAPLTTLSPWVDMRLRPIEEVVERLEAQPHRRFLKTHTPLDGLPAADGVTCLVVGRDPRDVALSMDHHRSNLDNDVLSSLFAAGGEELRPADRPADQRERLLRWIRGEGMDTLRGMIHHLGQAWERRDDPGVVLMHYANLSHDLDGEMRRLAGRLGITVDEAGWPELVEAASFGAMRDRAGELAPHERLGLFHNEQAFFRSGGTGEWRAFLTEDDVADYDERVRALAPSGEFVAWLHGGS